MPTDLEGIETYLAAKILYGPAKAANAAVWPPLAWKCPRTASASPGRVKKWTTS